MPEFAAERQQVADACRLLVEKGYFAGTGGNIGLRVSDELFAVTPSATDYAIMQAGDIALMRLDTLEQVRGDRPASIERGLHAAMLRAHPARPASIHTHQPLASAVALLHRDLPWPEGADTALLGPRAGLVPYRPSGTGMLVKALARVARPDLYVYLLASHGVVFVAPTLTSGIEIAGLVETAAARYLKQLIAGNARAASEPGAFVLSRLEQIIAENPVREEKPS